MVRKRTIWSELRTCCERLPTWLLFLSSLALVAVIGYIDFLTGDYSVLVFYLIPVGFASWFGGRLSGAGCALASGVARFLSDAAVYGGTTPLRYWNALEETLFLLMAGILVAVLRKALEQSRGAGTG
jgi:hypothetical protein